jgi:hypothetical protein
MNRIQKQSWIIVVSVGAAFVISCGIVVYLTLTAGFPAAWKGFIFTCAGGLGYFPSLLVKKDKPAIVDERDLAIRSLAKTNAVRGAFIFLVLFAMAVFVYQKPGNLIRVNVLPLSICLAAIVSGLFESLTYLFEYGKDTKAMKGETA